MTPDPSVYLATWFIFIYRKHHTWDKAKRRRLQAPAISLVCMCYGFWEPQITQKCHHTLASCPAACVPETRAQFYQGGNVSDSKPVIHVQYGSVDITQEGNIISDSYGRLLFLLITPETGAD